MSLDDTTRFQSEQEKMACESEKGKGGGGCILWHIGNLEGTLLHEVAKGLPAKGGVNSYS